MPDSKVFEFYNYFIRSFFLVELSVHMLDKVCE